MKHAQRQDQTGQAYFPFLEAVPDRGVAEDLLAKLRQCFFLKAATENPLPILDLIEDRFPETEKDCDFLRLSIRMAREWGIAHVRSMRVYHCDRIAKMMRTANHA